jgi:hypothetical protein
MNKDEINKRIYELRSEEEIDEFVNKRLLELEQNSTEKTVGQNYTDSFSDYISSKVHYKAGTDFGDSECPDLLYDDNTPYINLVKSLIANKYYNDFTLLTTIFYEVYNYLPSDLNRLKRGLIYMENINGELSIKTVREERIAFCSEKAGMAHNMFKFLGLDTEVVCGYRNEEGHAYNLFYPKGYGTTPVILYDPSFHIDFVKYGTKLSFGFYLSLSEEEVERFKNGEVLHKDLSKPESVYRRIYNLDDSYECISDIPTYTYGMNLGKKQETPDGQTAKSI